MVGVSVSVVRDGFGGVAEKDREGEGERGKRLRVRKREEREGGEKERVIHTDEGVKKQSDER